jgi:hypothetical protein
MIRRTILGTAIWAALIALVAAGPALASPIKWSEADVTCGTYRLGSFAFGLPTALPSVYAYNTTRRRDRQRVGIQFAAKLHYPGVGWVEQWSTEWYTAWAWDNMRAQAWISDRDGSRHLAWEKMQWQFTQSGNYRILIRVWHGATKYVTARRTPWVYPAHVGGGDENANGFPDYCFVAP